MATGLIGIDWGTTHRRARLFDASGRVLARQNDSEGMLASRGRFPQALAALVAALPDATAGTPIVMAGMVGGRGGWQEVPYLDHSAPLTDLAQHLRAVEGAEPGCAWHIVPGVCWRGPNGEIDVMRGEETQLYGALHWLGEAQADGWYVLPGTHSKWVQLQRGRIVHLRTYMTGELFASLRERGTLASAMQGAPDTPLHDSPAFMQGVVDQTRATLSHALFGARARIATGRLPEHEAAAYVSGLLVGAEWRDIQQLAADAEPIRIVGEPALADLHAACAWHFDCEIERLDADVIQQAAWRAFLKERFSA